MRKETCETCRHYTSVKVGTWTVDDDEAMEIPIVRHLCDGRQIEGTMAENFRCGRYETISKEVRR